MKTHNKVARLFIACILTLGLIGCDLFGSKDPEAGTIQVNVSNAINAEPLALNQAIYTSTAGHNYSVSLIEYILTNLAIRQEDGTLVSLESAHYCNEEDHDTHHVHEIELPAGRYTALSFTFGVDEAQNVFGNLERSTDLDNMMWPMMMPMGDGSTERYHYMRFEGRYGTDGVFRIHTGPSGGNDFSFDVEIPIELDVDGENWAVELVMNLDQWLTGPTTWDFDDYGMIMGNQAAQSIIQANGADVFSLGSITAE